MSKCHIVGNHMSRLILFAHIVNFLAFRTSVPTESTVIHQKVEIRTKPFSNRCPRWVKEAF